MCTFTRPRDHWPIGPGTLPRTVSCCSVPLPNSLAHRVFQKAYLSLPTRSFECCRGQGVGWLRAGPATEKAWHACLYDLLFAQDIENYEELARVPRRSQFALLPALILWTLSVFMLSIHRRH